MLLQQFSYEFAYKPGSRHTNADALSRIPAGDKVQINSVTEMFGDVDIYSKQQEDHDIAEPTKALQEGGKLPRSFMHQEKWLVLRDGILFRRIRLSTAGPAIDQLVLPPSLRQMVFHQLHNESGHFGVKKTQSKIQERVYWPGYTSYVKSWVQACKECQQWNLVHGAKAPLIPIVMSQPFEKIAWDNMGPLPITHNGNKYILVVTDLLQNGYRSISIEGDFI